MNSKTRLLTFIGLAITLATFSGCVKPVEPKQLIDASANETMFVVPLVGENRDNQAKLNSVDYYNQKKVAVKQIQVPQRWLQTGRFEHEGMWIPTVAVIKVDRTPITAEYAVNDKVSGKKDADAIWIESADSVGFSTGFSVSAMIQEEDTATFLYRYQAATLKQILATEVRARIQQNAANFAASYPLDVLRAKKNDMMKQIKEDVVPFFKERGITITTIAQFGGMTYENPKIQEAIDQVFVTQQEKERAKALLDAQKDINAKSEQATQQEKLNIQTLAQGKSEAIRLEAQAQAQAVQMKAEADAKGIEMVNKATNEAQSNPLFLKIRELEVQILKYNRWGGQVPATLVEGNGASGLNLFLSPVDHAVAAASVTK